MGSSLRKEGELTGRGKAENEVFVALQNLL